MDAVTAESLLAELHDVEAERARRDRDPALSARVQAVKTFQQQRFAHTYADLLAHPRYAPAARFFLQELYGPGDYRKRDAQFARVIPTLTRIFPAEVVDTVAKLARLHAMSEKLDSRMAERLCGSEVDPDSYAQAWRACGEPLMRQQQIELTMAIGASLDELTCKPLLRHTLRLMRGPATLAGLAELQAFLESGFDTFKAMRGAVHFLDTVREREENLAEVLFRGDAAAVAKALGQLP